MSISPLACVDQDARVGRDVTVGPFTMIGPDVEIGERSIIESHCVLGYDTPLARGPLVIGADAHVRTHSVLYRGSRFGAGLRTGHRITAREGIIAGAGVQIGTLSDLQGDTRIGDHVRTHSNVHVGKESTIEDFAWIYPYVVLTNDRQPPSEGPYCGPTIGKYAVIATMSVVLPGVRVGAHSLVAAHALVRKDVPDGAVVAGVPARIRGRTEEIMRDDGSDIAAYPWPRRFRRGYPDEVVARWERRWPSSDRQATGEEV